MNSELSESALVPRLLEKPSDAYASPYLRAVPDSPHGYDVADPTRLNPEIGTDEDYWRFVDALTPAFTELAATAEERLYVDGTARLFTEQRFQEIAQINELMSVLEHRVELLGALAYALSTPDVVVRIGAENEIPALRSLALVAKGYGLPGRPLGAVSVLGPVRMDYGTAISTVREAAHQLSRFVADVYEE